jgi:hypothetical protein
MRASVSRPGPQAGCGGSQPPAAPARAPPVSCSYSRCPLTRQLACACAHHGRVRAPAGRRCGPSLRRRRWRRRGPRRRCGSLPGVGVGLSERQERALPRACLVPAWCLPGACQGGLRAPASCQQRPAAPSRTRAQAGGVRVAFRTRATLVAVRTVRCRTTRPWASCTPGATWAAASFWPYTCPTVRPSAGTRDVYGSTLRTPPADLAHTTCRTITAAGPRSMVCASAR